MRILHSRTQPWHVTPARKKKQSIKQTILQLKAGRALVARVSHRRSEQRPRHWVQWNGTVHVRGRIQRAVVDGGQQHEQRQGGVVGGYLRRTQLRRHERDALHLELLQRRGHHRGHSVLHEEHLAAGAGKEPRVPARPRASVVSPPQEAVPAIASQDRPSGDGRCYPTRDECMGHARKTLTGAMDRAW
jgi:hypothetical protein